MKTKKLTKAQIAGLTLLAGNESADFYDLIRVGANGSTTTKLFNLGLITLKAHAVTGKTWCITQNGRDVLAAGRYAV